ncbi:hypothetical protein pclt_cds_571 [Pandoravirus celtis]|uniref:Uncharacterized protein n=1 Tax=Pandoravirus celtis TaxID=2568002 RepID=A0A4D6EHI4_9VIRU|nr:hypothetical protein pclt_cds_571 [Pandoravirus celtis]
MQKRWERVHKKMVLLQEAAGAQVLWRGLEATANSEDDDEDEKKSPTQSTNKRENIMRDFYSFFFFLGRK